MRHSPKHAAPVTTYDTVLAVILGVSVLIALAASVIALIRAENMF
jgi:hypothetical protein